MRKILVAILVLLVPHAALAQTASGSSVVYHSPDGSGARPASTAYLVLENGVIVNLFLDYDAPGDPVSSSGTLCVDANGHETCAFDVEIQLETDAATFGTFTPASCAPPAPSDCIVGSVDATARTLRVNGVNTSGMPIPAPIGTLVVNAAGANQAQIQALGAHRVGAAGQLEAIQLQVVMPEPSLGLLLGSGVLLLSALLRVRRSGHRSGA